MEPQVHPRWGPNPWNSWHPDSVSKQPSKHRMSWGESLSRSHYTFPKPIPHIKWKTSIRHHSIAAFPRVLSGLPSEFPLGENMVSFEVNMGKSLGNRIYFGQTLLSGLKPVLSFCVGKMKLSTSEVTGHLTNVWAKAFFGFVLRKKKYIYTQKMCVKLSGKGIIIINSN